MKNVEDEHLAMIIQKRVNFQDKERESTEMSVNIHMPWRYLPISVDYGQ